MAPGLTSVETEIHISNTFPTTKAQVPGAIFPDGLRTSGQHPPNYEELKGYGDYPESIEGPTLWKTKDYRDNPERWVHRFSETEIEEMSIAADNFKASETPLTGIMKVCWGSDASNLVRLMVFVGQFPSSKPLQLP